MKGSENISMMTRINSRAHPVGIAEPQTHPIFDLVVNSNSKYEAPGVVTILLEFVVLISNNSPDESNSLNVTEVKFFSASDEIILETTLPFEIFRVGKALLLLYSSLSQSKFRSFRFIDFVFYLAKAIYKVIYID